MLTSINFILLSHHFIIARNIIAHVIHSVIVGHCSSFVILFQASYDITRNQCNFKRHTTRNAFEDASLA